MKIYVIHNPADKLRAENIKTQFASQEGNWQYEIVEAVMNPSQTNVGTLRSFKKCIQKVWKVEKDCMILEDDVKFLTSSSLLRFYLAWNNTSPVYRGNILLGGLYEGDLVKENKNLPFSRIRGKLAGLHAMIIGCAAYKHILNAEEGYHLDYTLSVGLEYKMYCMDPMEIIQMPFLSSNGNNMEELNANLHLKYKLAGR